MANIIRKRRVAERKKAREARRNGKKNKAARSGIPRAKAPGGPGESSTKAEPGSGCRADGTLR
jgi:hypothetical protein